MYDVLHKKMDILGLVGANFFGTKVHFTKTYKEISYELEPIILIRDEIQTNRRLLLFY